MSCMCHCSGGDETAGDKEMYRDAPGPQAPPQQCPQRILEVMTAPHPTKLGSRPTLPVWSCTFGVRKKNVPASCLVTGTSNLSRSLPTYRDETCGQTSHDIQTSSPPEPCCPTLLCAPGAGAHLGPQSHSSPSCVCSASACPQGVSPGHLHHLRHTCTYSLPSWLLGF